jgi:hypothetical protein
MPALDITPFLGFRWWLDVFKAFPLNIFHTLALGTRQVLMWRKIGVESRAIIKGMHSSNEPMIFQSKKRSVHRVQGYGRNTSLNPFVNHVSRWVLVRGGQLTKDLETLMGEL